MTGNEEILLHIEDWKIIEKSTKKEYEHLLTRQDER